MSAAEGIMIRAGSTTSSTTSGTTPGTTAGETVPHQTAVLKERELKEKKKVKTEIKF